MLIRLNLLVILVLLHLILCLSEIKTQNPEVSDIRLPQGIDSSSSRSLYGRYSQRNCLLLYTGIYQQGYRMEVCYSTGQLTLYQMWNTQSICAPWGSWYGYPIYWLVYERPQFTGSYIYFTPGACVDNIRQYGLQSVSSVLLCLQISSYQSYNYYPQLTCYYPQQSWRQYTPISSMNSGNSQAFPIALAQKSLNNQTNG
uniref:Interleukin-4 inducing immunoglobulin-binding domain-containing protein n=1 Tax=Trichobilharzia regenti TaxID=157069 RepID=A0AA85K7C3_TRIRE|nr:unnamed protein product [Trichobilharzia regenti]